MFEHVRRRWNTRRSRGVLFTEIRVIYSRFGRCPMVRHYTAEYEARMMERHKASKGE